MYVQFNKKSREGTYLYQAKVLSQTCAHFSLAGAVPATIGNLTNLKTLMLYGNELEGESKCMPRPTRALD